MIVTVNLPYRVVTLVCALLVGVAAPAAADAVTEWNVRACDVACSAKIGPVAYRVMACVQTAVYEAVNAVTQKYPRDPLSPEMAADASIDAAVAAASRTILNEMLPAEHARIDSMYAAALAQIPDGPAKSEGVALGERAAAAVSAVRRDDGAATLEQFRPVTAPGQYIPTTLPAVPQWPQRKPWVLATPGQFRPGPPPALSSDTWSRDFNEIKALGAAQSTVRTPEQTAIAHFWEATLPPIYFGLLQSVVTVPDREITRNARLLAVASQAIDDALIAVMDAKYHYNFWRPVTAIRNADNDGNDATERDPSWKPYIETPMHPEYPCAHCAVASAVSAVIAADLGSDRLPTLRTTSLTAPGAERSWTNLRDFVSEVENGRVYDGVHYRNSTKVGSELGRQVGGLVASSALRPIDQ